MVSFSKNTSVIINSGSVTTRVSNFSESGGETKFASSKGFGKIVDTGSVFNSDYEVLFDVLLSGSEFYDIVDGGTTTVSVQLQDNSIPPITELTLTYTNVLPKVVTGGLNADGYFKGTLSLLIPYYDSTGAKNRTVS